MTNTLPTNNTEALALVEKEEVLAQFDLWLKANFTEDVRYIQHLVDSVSDDVMFKIAEEWYSNEYKDMYYYTHT